MEIIFVREFRKYLLFIFLFNNDTHSYCTWCDINFLRIKLFVTRRIYNVQNTTVVCKLISDLEGKDGHFFYLRQLKKKSFLTILVEFSNGDTDNCTGVAFVINYNIILNCNQFGSSGNKYIISTSFKRIYVKNNGNYTYIVDAHRL